MAVSLKFPKSLLLLSLLLYCPHSHSAVLTSQDIPSDIPTPKPCPLGCAPEVPGLKRGNSRSPRSTSTSTFAGVYYSPEDIANLRANAEARALESPTPVFPYFEAAEPNYWEDTDPSGPWGGASIEFLNLAAIPSPTDVTNVEASNEQVEEVEAPEEDNMIYYTEFKEFFSGLKGFSSEFTDAAKYKTAVKEGIPLPGLTTPSPYMTLAPKAKREVEESENINVESMDTMDFEKRHMMPDMGSKASGFKDHPNPLFKQTSSLPSCGDPGQRYEMVHKDANSGVYRKFLPCGQQCYNPRTHVCNNKQIGPKMPYKRRDMSSGVVEESENSNVESMDTMAFEKRDAKSYTKDPAGKLCRGQPYNTEQVDP
ncbi:hypothetical protein K440DRAFT_643821 [Wilcoxina mikolae CBS 423.85]|nr:hypothetical protein K440DRAFT_643821 [Wilcoxina mikolae CBS 423.85]